MNKFKIESILDEHPTHFNIKWKGYKSKYNTREPKKIIKTYVPEIVKDVYSTKKRKRESSSNSGVKQSKKISSFMKSKRSKLNLNPSSRKIRQNVLPSKIYVKRKPNTKKVNPFDSDNVSNQTNVKCRYGDYEYIRNTQKEEELNNIIYNSKLQIKNILNKIQNSRTNIPGNGLATNTLPPLSNNSFYNNFTKEITEIKEYQSFLWYTTEQIDLKATTYKYNFPNNFISSSKQINYTPYTIAIICYGRSLDYLLKYVSYLLSNWENRNTPITLLFFCENESFEHYQQDSQQITYTEDISKPKLFSLTNTLSITPNEKQMFESPLLNMYFIESSHYLMYGVGAKRGYILYYFYNYISKQSNDVCMTIDDNITAMVELEEECRNGKGTTSYCCIRNNDVSNTVPDRCHFLTLLDVYDKLNEQLNENKNIYFCGIPKGHGRTETTIKDKFEYSSVVYKLNLSRPSPLIQGYYFYNPYFTRFYEDMAFNGILNQMGHIAVYAKYYLRFGHNKGNNDKDKDTNDLLSQVLISKNKSVKSVEPIYIMYLLLFVLLDKNDKIILQKGNAEGKTTDFANFKRLPLFGFLEGTSDRSITYNSDSKYLKYQLMLYLYFSLYFITTPLPHQYDSTLCTNTYSKESSTQTFNYCILKQLGYIKEEPSINNQIYYQYTIDLRFLTFETYHLNDYYDGNISTEIIDINNKLNEYQKQLEKSQKEKINNITLQNIKLCALEMFDQNF